MSGGSFNYLYQAVLLENLGERRGMIEAMQKELDVLTARGVPGAAVAALETRIILRYFEMADRRAKSLEEVWHAVEWWVDGDWGDDQLREVLAAYEAQKGRLGTEFEQEVSSSGAGEGG